MRLISRVSKSLNIPIRLVKTNAAEYEISFEKVLTGVKSKGAEACVFGDIDIEEQYSLVHTLCRKRGARPIFSSFERGMQKLVYKFIDAGFMSIITIVDTSRLSDEFLGKG